MSKIKRYIDLDLDMIPHPITNDVVRKYDNAAVIRSVRNLVLTNFYDRPFHPEIGSSLKAMLFENDTLYTRGAVAEAIKSVIEVHEKRVTNNEVVVEKTSDDLGYKVIIFLQIVGTIEPVDFSLTLERVR